MESRAIINQHVTQSVAKIQSQCTEKSLLKINSIIPEVGRHSQVFNELEELFIAGLRTGRAIRPVEDTTPAENNSRSGLNYWGDKPEDRIREASGDPLHDNIIGILIGFKATLEKRGGWMDMITSAQAKEEIIDLIIKCGGDPRVLGKQAN